MGLYNFKPMFVEPILEGRKLHTIRATRKHMDKPGDTMHLYTGLRTKQARLLMRRECVKVDEILIDLHESIWINDLILSADERESLARADGFESFAQMMKFWEGRLPFHGHIFHWSPR